MSLALLTTSSLIAASATCLVWVVIELIELGIFVNILRNEVVVCEDICPRKIWLADISSSSHTLVLLMEMLLLEAALILIVLNLRVIHGLRNPLPTIWNGLLLKAKTWWEQRLLLSLICLLIGEFILVKATSIFWWISATRSKIGINVDADIHIAGSSSNIHAACWLRWLLNWRGNSELERSWVSHSLHLRRDLHAMARRIKVRDLWDTSKLIIIRVARFWIFTFQFCLAALHGRRMHLICLLSFSMTLPCLHVSSFLSASVLLVTFLGSIGILSLAFSASWLFGR